MDLTSRGTATGGWPSSPEWATVLTETSTTTTGVAGLQRACAPSAVRLPLALDEVATFAVR